MGRKENKDNRHGTDRLLHHNKLRVGSISLNKHLPHHYIIVFSPVSITCTVAHKQIQIHISIPTKYCSSDSIKSQPSSASPHKTLKRCQI